MNRTLPNWAYWLLALGLISLAGWFRDRSNTSGRAPSALAATDPHSRKSLTDTRLQWPSPDKLKRTFTLADYNTRVVYAGVTTLGAAAGLVGTFLLLRKRSLLSDTVSHCTLPGIATAFIGAEALGFSGRSLPVLLTGATVSGVLGMMAVAAIRTQRRVKDDAALAIVLSVFFGLGIALLVIVQQLPTGNAAGLSHYIYGKAASLTANDAALILTASVIVAAVCGLLFKEFKLLCFDSDFARTQGWPAMALDLTLMGLVVAVTVIGLQAVGLLLVVALLIIPAAAARFWSHRLGVNMLLASGLGASSGFLGVTASALFPNLPAGAVIVLAAIVFFAVSFIFGARRGVWVRWLEQRRVAARVARQHLLRAIYEWCERPAHPATPDRMNLLDQPISIPQLQALNHWSPQGFAKLLKIGLADGLVTASGPAQLLQLTPQGKLEARRVTRNHRLWETYLLHYAAVAPQHIHHNADQIEHVIEPSIVNELEVLLAGRADGVLVPSDPEKPEPFRSL